MHKKTCTNKNQCCDDDRCYCDEVENIVLEHDEMKMIAQMVRLSLRELSDHPSRWRMFGNETTVREKLSVVLKKMKL